MMRSMYAGVSGLRAHQLMMDVVGNNIANVNTVGFKASRVQFSDTLSQILRAPSGGTGGASSISPMQVGLGVGVEATNLVMSQGAHQLTERSLDVAINGEGFFVADRFGEELYTRVGSFKFDQSGFLIDSNGGFIQGWNLGTGQAIDTGTPPGRVQLTPGGTIDPKPTSVIRLGGNVPASAEVDASATRTSIEVIDVLGSEHRVGLNFTKTAANEWLLSATGPDGADLGSATLTFDGATGQLIGDTTLTGFSLTPSGGASPVNFSIDLVGEEGESPLTQFGDLADVRALDQDGATVGFLRSFAISDEGIITGLYSNGDARDLAQTALALFSNPGDLLKEGDSYYRSNGASGNPSIGASSTNGRGSISAGVLEMSNVELAREFTDLIVAQRGFQANSRLITTSDEMIQELVNLKR